MFWHSHGYTVSGTIYDTIDNISRGTSGGPSFGTCDTVDDIIDETTGDTDLVAIPGFSISFLLYLFSSWAVFIRVVLDASMGLPKELLLLIENFEGTFDGNECNATL